MSGLGKLFLKTKQIKKLKKNNQCQNAAYAHMNKKPLETKKIASNET